MSEPKILRRCTVCGAASRPGAVFCPQCGNATGKSGALDVPPDETQDLRNVAVFDETQDLRNAAVFDETQDLRNVAVFDETQDLRNAAVFDETQDLRSAAVFDETQDLRSAAPLNPALHTRKLGSLDLSVRPKREVSKREGPRQPASVVVAGSTYDPSIRFVVVAAVLFVVFLVILLLSKMIT